MNDIFDTNADFPFDKISLITPTSMSGGVHFSKILINKKQLYIQSPKCKTKQGVVKSGKKIHADLVFSHDDEEFIQWIEMLELTIRKHIFTNREKWFDMDMDEDDIESYFSPTVKIFKSGKQYIMRVNVSQRVGSSPLKIYDENETDVEMDTIQENTPIITILEIQGVRCSAKSFQIDVELKQMMVMKPDNLFERCIIKSKEKDLVKMESEEPLIEEKKVIEEPLIEEKKVIEEPLIEEKKVIEDNDILEINLDVDEFENLETIHLKEKTEVYYQMYKEARQKAKLAKSLALSSYLEARRIKNLYMLEDIDDSDESDLEDLENE